MDEHEAQALADIDRFGWTVFHVSNDIGPDFAYSVGMFQTLSHPDPPPEHRRPRRDGSKCTSLS